MDDRREPAAALPDTPGAGDAVGVAAPARPRVVVVVAARQPALSPAARLRAPVSAPVRVAVVGEDAGGPAAGGPADDDQPTTKIHKPARPRRAEDDRLVATVIPLDLQADPGPLSAFLGRTLLFRAARAAALAGSPRLILVGEVPEDARRAVHEEAYAGFLGRPIEMRGSDPGQQHFGQGRVLILDGAALHDPEAVQRLARVRGDGAALLLGECGHGLRVRTTEGGKVREIGIDIAARVVMSGAASVPAEHFERFTQVGERAALQEMAAGDQLRGEVAPETSYGQQFDGPGSFRRAQRECFGFLAGEGSEGFFDDWLGRPLARMLTRALLPRPWATPASTSVLAGVLALCGAFLVAFGGPWGVLCAGGLLVLSAVLDRTDGELARLRLDDDRGRGLDMGLDHLSHAAVFLGLAWAVEQGGQLHRAAALVPGLSELMGRFQADALELGWIAVLGVALLGVVLLLRGKPRPGERGAFRRAGDALAGSFGSRDFFYLLVPAAALDLLLPGAGVLAFLLLLGAAAVHLLWVVIGVLSLLGGGAGRARGQ